MYVNTVTALDRLRIDTNSHVPPLLISKKVPKFHVLDHVCSKCFSFNFRKSILIDAKNTSADFIILFASSLHKSSHTTSNDHFQSYLST